MTYFITFSTLLSHNLVFASVNHVKTARQNCMMVYFGLFKSFLGKNKYFEGLI